MDLLIETILNSAVEIIVFSAVPLIWWAVTSKKGETFFHWIGLRKVCGKKVSILPSAILTLLGFIAISLAMLNYVSGTATAASQFYALGSKALPAILVYAILNTSLPEELFFRGFLLKRLSNRLGFGWGNVLQSLMFGMLHGALFISHTGLMMTFIMILFTGAVAWCMGYINENKSCGSIIPSWLIHAAANIFSGLCYAFMLV